MYIKSTINQLMSLRHKSSGDNQREVYVDNGGSGGGGGGGGGGSLGSKAPPPRPV